ncbi:MAG: hypothetical protein AAFY76_13090, partial [Cyanobacteria bacterium J06649_11]
MTLNFREEDEHNPNSYSSEKSIIEQHLAIDDENISSDSNEIENDDKTDEEDTEPIKSITKHNFASSPWSMMGAVGGAFFLVFGISYLFLNSVFNSDSATVADTENKQLEVEAETNEEQDNDGEVRAKLALKQQQDELDKLNQSQDDNEEVTKKVKKLPEDKTDVKVTTKPRTVSRRETRNISMASPARRIRTVPRRSIPSQPRPKPVRQTTLAPKRMEKIASSINRPSQVERDPLAELNRLRTIGSFGEIDYNEVNKKNNSRVKETLVASTSPVYETPRERRLRRREMQSENTTSTRWGNPNTSKNTGSQISKVNNTIEKITPKWEPVFETRETEYSPDIPSDVTPDNQPNLIASSSPNISVTSNYLPQSQNLNFINEAKQAKINQNKNKYVTQNSNSFIDKIKQAKYKNNHHPSQLSSNQQYLVQEERFFEASKPKYLMVGEHASGRLLTPISQGQKEEQSSDSKRFVAKLTQNIRNNTGAI